MFGITGDFAASPDLGVLAHGIEDGMAELVKAAGHHARPASLNGSHRSFMR